MFITISTRIKIFLIHATFANFRVFMMVYASPIFATAPAFITDSVVRIVNANPAINTTRGSKFLAVGINQTLSHNLNMLSITNIVFLENDV